MPSTLVNYGLTIDLFYIVRNILFSIIIYAQLQKTILENTYLSYANITNMLPKQSQIHSIAEQSHMPDINGYTTLFSVDSTLLRGKKKRAYLFNQ